MKKFMCLLALSLTTALFCCNDAHAGSGKGSGKGGGKNFVDICNHNQFDDENGDIRIWVLTEEEASNPPATKAEAEALESVLVAAESLESVGDLDMGATYVLVATNETHFQSLGADDSFAPETDFSVAQFVSEGPMSFSVVNGDGDNRVPVITEGCDGGGDDGDGGGGDGGMPPM